MKRRTLLGLLAVVPPLRVWAQTAGFPGNQSANLRVLAKQVLPSEIDREKVVVAFEAWVRNYRPGAEMDHGYGFTRLRTKPPNPAPQYLQQLKALGPNPDIEAALTEAKVTALPQTPDGKHIATDLMAFYFRSSEANDLCYRAYIGRDECRGLQGSEVEPAVLPTVKEH